MAKRRKQIEEFNEAWKDLAATLLRAERCAHKLGMIQRSDENRWDALFRFRYQVLYGEEHPSPSEKVAPALNTLQLIVMRHASRKVRRIV